MSLNSYPGNARLNVSPTDVINRSQILHYYFLSLSFHIYIGLLGNIRLPALLLLNWQLELATDYK